MLRPNERVIVIGPTPPPIHGVAFMTAHVLDAIRGLDRLAGHLDTRDPRPVVTAGRLDLRNTRLAVVHAARLAVLLARHRGAAVYLPVSQGRWGFLRDAVFIWMAVLFGRRVIIHVHGGSFRGFVSSSGPLMRRTIRATVRRVSQAWVLTPVHRALFEGILPESRVKVLQNTSADLGAQLDGGLARPGTEATRRFLYLSNLLPEKGFFDLLDALDLLGERGTGIELRFAGEAEDAVIDQLRQRALQLSARGVSVRWEGVLTGVEKVAALAWAQVFVLPSRYPEGQPISVIEAMSAGLPVISTDRGQPFSGPMARRLSLSADPSGVPYTARDGKEALIVPPGEPQALAGAILQLIEQPELRARLGDGARRRYVERYRPKAFQAAVGELLAPSTARM